MRLIKVLDTIDKNIYGQGSYKHLMWMYNPDTLTLSIANKSNFDRWANSRIIDIYPVLFDSGDPRLVYILDKLSEACEEYGSV